MYDAEKASAAQEQYCREHNAPCFAPNRNIRYQCFRCNQNIFAERGHPIARKLPRGRFVLDYGVSRPGITVEEAGKELITGCPFCNWSFCD